MSGEQNTSGGEGLFIEFQFAPHRMRRELDPVIYESNIASHNYLLYLLEMADTELQRLAEIEQQRIKIPVKGDYEFKHDTFDSPISVILGDQLNRALVDQDIDRVCTCLATYLANTRGKISEHGMGMLANPSNL